MRHRIFYAYNSAENNTYPKDVIVMDPRQCMHCGETGVQNFITGATTDGEHDELSSICLYNCPLCESTTIHFFVQWDVENMDTDFDGYQSVFTIPAKKEKLVNIPEELQNQFPDFFEIYSQSQKAEKENLNQIAGMGYRKALEFLVTDYLIEYPVDGVDEEWLKNPNITLGSKISKISRERIQNLARAISFIGNDETHYSRRHPEHDIESMKAFIRALLAEIANDIEYKKAMELINKPKP